MNPMQILMNQLQTQIKSRNPQLFKQFEQMKNNNPQDMINQLVKPEQREAFSKYVKSFGITDEQLNQVLTHKS